MILSKNNGFTLIELSIVLVIIALLVGGVATGKELLNQSVIRSQIKQLQGYQTAFMTFKGKYGCYAGDCPNGDVLFGLDPADNGDGNGLVEFRDNVDGKAYGFVQVYPAPGQPNYGDYLARLPRWGNSSPEVQYALIQLSEAYLVEDMFDETWPSGGKIAAGNGMAATKYDKSKGFFIGSQHNFYRVNTRPNYMDFKVDPGNYIWMAAGSRYTGAVVAWHIEAFAGLDAYVGIFTPVDVKSIDTKIDDGMPLTGKFLGHSATNYNWECVVGAGGDYRLTDSRKICFASYRID